MAITDRTRKILWARSGNKCCWCRTDLIRQKEHPDNSTVIGEECHIISQKPNGPRYHLIENFDYDAEQNLILFCANCHKMADEQIGYFTIDCLRRLKESHEEFIRIQTESLHPENLSPKIDGITVLPKINSGKELFNILNGCMGMEYDFEDTKNPHDIEFISGILQDLQDSLDYLGFEVEIAVKVGTINQLNNLLQIIEEHEFYLFGERKEKKISHEEKSISKWNIATLYLMKKGNPNIFPPNFFNSGNAESG